MHRIVSLTIGVLLCYFTSTTRGAQDDPISTKLDAGKKKYDAAIAKYREEAAASFTKREETARKGGNKKLVDQIKDEVTAFEETGELPLTSTVLRKSRASAIKQMEDAYSLAIKEYTAAKKDDLATATDKDLKKFWLTEKFPPGVYEVNLDSGKLIQMTDLRGEGKVISVRKDGKDTTDKGVFEVREGKLLVKCDAYVEVWALKEGKIVLEHYYPASSYPSGKLNAIGVARRVK